MPTIVRLFSRATDEYETFQMADDKVRAYLGERPNSRDYLCDWYNSIGLRLARGFSWDEIRADLVDHPDLLQILAYLQENYYATIFNQMKF